jgi:hypothetical protein
MSAPNDHTIERAVLGAVACLDAALNYLQLGFSVIPTRPGDKRPVVAWGDYQRRRPTRAELISWWRRWPTSGVALVCGHVSGFVVVDFDPRNGEGLPALAGRLPITPTAETGGGGQHFYFRLVPDERIPKIAGLLRGVDLQSSSSYVVAPPSLHASGHHYRWRPGLALGEVPLAPIPLIVRQLVP